MPRRNNTPKHQPYIDTSTCKSKRRFGDETAARKAADLLELQSNAKVSIYKCDRCGGWHLTSRTVDDQKN